MAEADDLQQVTGGGAVAVQGFYKVLVLAL